MSLELEELYQEMIIDHNRHPRHHYLMKDASTSAEGFNPLCGDKLRVFLKIEDEVIQAASFLGCGCAISQASASLMTEAVLHQPVAEAEALFERFHNMLTRNLSGASLGKLSALAGVRAFPARVKCATLAWHTLEAALKKNKEIVTTE